MVDKAKTSSDKQVRFVFIADSRRSQVRFFLLLLILLLNGPLRAQQGNKETRPINPAEGRFPSPYVPPADISSRAQNDASQSSKMMAHMNEIQLQKDAKALGELCASISAEMNAVQNGALPKDVVEKLKIVEKLSKRVREELTRSAQANQH
jgi:hypothetical protein